MKADVNLVGNLTRDTTAVFGEDGTAKRALFTVACNSRFKNAAGEKVEKVDFIPCIAWNGLADTMKEWGLKGRKVQIKGTLESFQKPVKDDGTYDPTKIQVRVVGIEFLGMEDNVKTKLNAEKKAEPPVAQGNAAEVLASLLGMTTPVATPPPVAQPAIGQNELIDAITMLLNQPAVKTAAPAQPQEDTEF